MFVWLAFAGLLGVASLEAVSSCEEPVEALGKLMQVASERTQHPGTGKALPEVQVGGKMPAKKVELPDKEHSTGLQFSLGILGSAFPDSELLPLGLMVGPESGGGTVLVLFTLLILLLVCALALVTFLNEDEEPAAKRSAEGRGVRSMASTTATVLSSQPVLVSGPGTWQPSQDSARLSAASPAAPPAPLAAPTPLPVNPPRESPRRAEAPQRQVQSQARPWASSYLPKVPATSNTPQAARPWGSSYLPEAAETSREENHRSLPPMLSALPPVWGGGPSPVAEDVETSEVSRPSTFRRDEDGAPLVPLPTNFADLPVAEADFDGDLDTSGTLCPEMLVDPTSECAMAVPIAHQDMQALSMTIMSLDQRPVLRAEVYRGDECRAPEYFSPMIGDLWPPEDVRLVSSDRGNQHPSVVLTSLPPEVGYDSNEEVEDVAIFSTCYLVKSDANSLQFDIYNGSGEFFGRMGRDESRSCRFVLRGGNFGEVRYFVDGVFEDYAVLFTDMCQDTLADGEAFDLTNLPFPQAAGCMRLRIHGAQAVDAGLILTMLFCAYELRSLDA